MAASTNGNPSTSSTKQKLLTLIEDVDLVSRELFELMSTPKGQQRPGAPEPSDLVQLLVDKDKEIKECLTVATKQAEVQKTIDELKHEVDRRDFEIKLLQRNLKEAENVLSTAIFQAKQKLQTITQANSKKISSEELIKFAHRISASNAVEAPPTWQPGDPRRPYPTDYEMRGGWLAKMSGEIPPPNPAMQSQGFYGEPMASNRQQHLPDGQFLMSQQPTSMLWQSQSDTGSGSYHHIMSDLKGAHNKENGEVELMMSSDSSSSSSSDE